MKILLGVTGGIAAFRAAELAHQLVKAGHNVRVAMTAHAREFITPLTFTTLTGFPTATDTFTSEGEVEHIALAQWPDMLLVAPATANYIGKVAGGLADDLLTTITMAILPETPVLLAPAMNTRMWENPLVQANVAKLLAVPGKYRLIPPRESLLACGDYGVGAMAELETILAAVAEYAAGSRAR